MHKSVIGILTFSLIFVAAIPSAYKAQLQSSASSHQPRGTATDVSGTEIDAIVKKLANTRVADKAIRVISINSEYNVGVSVVRRAQTSGAMAKGAIEHSQITEVYHVMEGHGTLVTGGTINDLKEVPPDNEVVTLLNGPSSEGSTIQAGVSRQLSPGDVVVIPPNTPHWFSEISTPQIVYLVVRIDPHKLLPAGYVAK
jgi:mannose-6-phosphate isomerase-like protein (cupin superfamily)